MKLWLLLLIPVSLARASCPNIEDIPIMFDADHFTCAKVWTGKGPESGDLTEACKACGSLGTDLYADGDSRNTNGGYHYPMGSIIVKAGCNLTMYYDTNFSGYTKKLEGPVVEPSNVWGHYHNSCGNGPTSFRCKCQQKPIFCSPFDSLELVMVCDNTNGGTDPSECRFNKTIGSAYNTQVMQNMQIDPTIEVELKRQFFGRMAILGNNVDIGYDWTDMSEDVKQDEESFEDYALVPPGVSLFIEQVVGYCDTNTVKTDLFIMTLQNRHGVNQTYPISHMSP